MSRKKNRQDNRYLQDTLFRPDQRWVPPTKYPDLSDAKIISVDVETRDPKLKEEGPGDIRRDGYVVGISIATDTGHNAYYPIRHLGGGNVDPGTVLDYMRDILSRDLTFVFCNAPYDLGWLVTANIAVNGQIWDIQHNEALIDEERKSYSLESIGRYWGVKSKEYGLLEEALDAYGLKGRGDLWKLPSCYVGPYAQTDTHALLPIFERQMKEINRQNLMRVAMLESRLIPLVHRMRQQGVPVDVDRAEQISNKWKEDEDELRRRFYSEYAYEPDEWSGDKIARTCDKLKIDYPRTEKGNPSFTGDFLKYTDHPFLKLVRDIRSINRLRTKYIDDLILRRNIRGRIHPRYHQTRDEDGGARTGRFSMSDPSLHQVPIRDPELGPIIRGLFTAKQDGALWCKNDYSQQEPRLTVHYAHLMGLRRAAEFVDAYHRDPDMDFYEPIITQANITRRLGKDIALGRNYGMGGRKMARKLNVSPQRCAELLAKFDGAAPFIRSLSELCSRKAQQRGYIYTILGRKRHFTAWEPYDSFQRRKRGEYIVPTDYGTAKRLWPNTRLVRANTKDAFNSLIQGSAADQTKLAMVEMFEQLSVVPYIQVHDEVDSPVANEGDAETQADVMRECIKLEIPVKVDTTIGESWK